MITKIANGIIISDTLLQGKNLYIEDSRIASITEDELYYDHLIDAQGAYVSPGFVDIHAHGAGNCDFADGGEECIAVAAETHGRHGTTSIFPTCTSSSFEDTCAFVENVREAMKKNSPGRPYVAGSHLEGPYFSHAMRGAQNPAYLKPPDPAEYKKLAELGKGTLRRISFAPELEGATELCRFLKSRGIVASFGHTDGIYEDIKPCIDEGCRLATHLYSGMNTVVRRNLERKLGAVETTFLENEVTAEIICDGIHLPPPLLRLIYQIKGPDRLCLVTDSMRGAGTEEGQSILGPLHDGTKCVIQNGVAYLCDMTAFAGSAATADRLVRVMYRDVGIPLCDCIKMMCRTPAQVMGLKERGELSVGKLADIVLFDENIQVQKVIIEGKEFI